MTDRAPPLPKLLADIAEALGTGAALRLAREHGGRILSIPKRPTRAFVEKVGGDAALAAWLCEHRDVQVDVPLGPTGSRAERWARLHDAIKHGDGSASDLARTFGVAGRTVKRHRARVREGDGALPLFASSPSDT